MGMMSKRKGYGFERELVNGFRDSGFECRRIPLSGAGEEKGDIELTCGWGQKLKGEAKRRACLPAYLQPGSHDFTVFRQDRGETLVLVRLSLFRELCQ